MIWKDCQQKSVHDLEGLSAEVNVGPKMVVVSRRSQYTTLKSQQKKSVYDLEGSAVEVSIRP